MFLLISSNLAEIAIVFLWILVGLPTTLIMIQFLWLNLIADGATALALAMKKGDPDVMDQSPCKTDESIINSTMHLGIMIHTIVQTAAVLGTFTLGLSWYLGYAIPAAGANAFSYLLQYD